MNVAADLIVHPSYAGLARKHVAKPNTEKYSILIETIGAEDGEMERARDECGGEYGLHPVEIFVAITFDGDVHQRFPRSFARDADAEDFVQMQRLSAAISVTLAGINNLSPKPIDMRRCCPIE